MGFKHKYDHGQLNVKLPKQEYRILLRRIKSYKSTKFNFFSDKASVEKRKWFQLAECKHKTFMLEIHAIPESSYNDQDQVIIFKEQSERNRPAQRALQEKNLHFCGSGLLLNKERFEKIVLKMIQFKAFRIFRYIR